MPTDSNLSNLGDGANPTPCGDPDPVAVEPDPDLGTVGADNDCGGEDDRADSDESDDDEYVVTVRRDADDLDADGDPIQSWFWSGDPLMAVFDSAAGAKAGADEHYDGKLDWWEEEPEYWMAHRPLGFNDIRDEDYKRADPDGDGLADCEGVRYRTDDCDEAPSISLDEEADFWGGAWDDFAAKHGRDPEPEELAQRLTGNEEDCDDEEPAPAVDLSMWEDMATYRPEPDGYVEPAPQRVIDLLNTSTTKEDP